MNYSEVKELLSAGFTADEIRGMMAGNNPQQKQPEQKQPEQKQPEQKQPEQKQPEQKQPEQKQPEQKQPEQKQPEQKQPEQKQPEQKQPEQNPDDARFNQLNDTMEKLIKTIQHSNLNNNSFDKMKETDIDSQVDQIMAGIIRPEREKGGTEK